MIKLREETIECLNYIIENGTDNCNVEDCATCVLGHFDNSKCSCAKNAKKLLELLKEGNKNE